MHSSQKAPNDVTFLDSLCDRFSPPPPPVEQKKERKSNTEGLTDQILAYRRTDGPTTHILTDRPVKQVRPNKKQAKCAQPPPRTRTHTIHRPYSYHLKLIPCIHPINNPFNPAESNSLVHFSRGRLAVDLYDLDAAAAERNRGWASVRGRAGCERRCHNRSKQDRRQIASDRRYIVIRSSLDRRQIVVRSSSDRY